MEDKAVMVVSAEQGILSLLEEMAARRGLAESCRFVHKAGGPPLALRPLGGGEQALSLPVRPGAVLDRVRRILAMDKDAGILRLGPCRLALDTALLVNGETGAETRLTEKEKDILAVLEEAGESTLSRQDLLARVWGYGADIETHTLETHIYRLRQKLEACAGTAVLLVTEETGYRLAL